MDRKALAKTSLLLTTQVVVSAVTLFGLYKFIFRTLGADNLGLWSLVLATTGVARFTDLGLSGSLGRFVARYRALNNLDQAILVVETGVTSVAALLTVIGAVAIPLLRLALAVVIPHDKLSIALALLPYAIVSVVASSVASTVQGALDGCARLDLRALLVIAANIVYVALAIPLSHFHGLMGLAWAQVAQAVLLAVFGWLILRRVMPGVPLVPHRWRTATFREMIGYSTAYQAASISMLLYEPVTKALLAKYGGLTDVGLYEMASRVVNYFRNFITASQQSILPLAAEAKERGVEAVTSLYEKAVQGMVSILFPTLAVLVASAPLISLLWLGSLNRPFVHLLVVLALANGLQICNGPAYFTLLGVGSAFWIAVANMTVGLSNLLFSLPLAHFKGAPGVIAGSLAAFIMGSVVIIARFHLTYPISWRRLAPKRALYGLLVLMAAILVEEWIQAFTLRSPSAMWALWAGTALVVSLASVVSVGTPLMARLADQEFGRSRRNKGAVALALKDVVVQPNN